MELISKAVIPTSNETCGDNTGCYFIEDLRK